MCTYEENLPVSEFGLFGKTLHVCCPTLQIVVGILVCELNSPKYFQYSKQKKKKPCESLFNRKGVINIFDKFQHIFSVIQFLMRLIQMNDYDKLIN